jgi:anthranilate phosphoribosyltransferase
MKEILEQLFEFKQLSYDVAKQTLTNIGLGKYNQSQVAAFMTVFLMRPVSLNELAGFRDALLDLCEKIDLSEFNTIDLCGTGGDGKDTFNISTSTAFVVAGAGYKVAKHGNYGVSSGCGSSNVLEYLGYQFSNNPEMIKKSIDKSGICFLHAPLFHPAMKNVGPIRRDLQIKTFFNLLGPLVNPSFPKNQMVGVYNLEIARTYAYLFQRTDSNFTILHSLDGYDEISLTGKFKLLTRSKENILSPHEIGFKNVERESIQSGGSIKAAASVFMGILEGRGTEAQNQVVLANTVFAILCINPSATFESALEQANDSLFSGKALKALNTLLALS